MKGTRFTDVPPKYLAVPLAYVRGSVLTVARYPQPLQIYVMFSELQWV